MNAAHEEAVCALCGGVVSTHPDAGATLDRCGWCNRVTCPDCRKYTDKGAAKCSACDEQQGVVDDLVEALRGVLNKRGCVPGCPRDRNSDAAHNLRCTRARAAITKATEGGQS